MNERTVKGSNTMNDMSKFQIRIRCVLMLVLMVLLFIPMGLFGIYFYTDRRKSTLKERMKSFKGHWIDVWNGLIKGYV